jgi:hypothetical protein
MKRPTRSLRISAIAAGAITIASVIFAGHFYLYGQDKSGFPDGYDAVQAAPKSHRIIFENSLVRVLEVTMPAPGQTEPMHHHRWPSFFLDWDTGGPSPHIRYHRGGGTVVDQPSQPSPKHPGHWTVHWMKPEPLHGIETVELPETQPDEPGIIRVELKFKP